MFFAADADMLHGAMLLPLGATKASSHVKGHALAAAPALLIIRSTSVVRHLVHQRASQGPTIWIIESRGTHIDAGAAYVASRAFILLTVRGIWLFTGYHHRPTVVTHPFHFATKTAIVLHATAKT